MKRTTAPPHEASRKITRTGFSGYGNHGAKAGAAAFACEAQTHLPGMLLGQDGTEQDTLGEEELDSLEDLFGCLEEAEEHTMQELELGDGLASAPAIEKVRGNGQSDDLTGRAAFHSALRTVLAQIDSKEERSAQQQSVEAQKVQTILSTTGKCPAHESPCTPPPGTNTDLTDLDANVHQPPNSWVHWVCTEDGTPAVTRASVQGLLQRLKANCTTTFPLQDALQLLRAACRGGLASETAVREIAIPEPADGAGQMVIVGDTHGQLEDVMWILFKHGEPNSTDNVYLFNGDVADRGKQALEILLLMAMYSLSDPGSVFMNRGNHEDSFLTSMYGFRDECMGKYGRDGGRRVYDLSRELFNSLALATVVNAGGSQRIFVVHGGLPRSGACLEDISRLDFRREVPAPPLPGEELDFFDCLWADPWSAEGVGPNPRGLHVASFGPDVTEAFLRKSSVDLVVRSHAVPGGGRGFEWHHGGRVLTVFSASNYAGRAGNLGGVAVLRKCEDIETHEHWAGSIQELSQLEGRVSNASAKLRAEAVLLAEKRRERRSRAEGLEKLLSYTLCHVQEQVVAHKADLFEFWTARDLSEDFHVTPEVWRQGMARHIGEELPWKWVQEKLGAVDQDTGLVPYTRFLQRFRVAQDTGGGEGAESPSGSGCVPKKVLGPGWQGVVVRRVFESLLRADLCPRDALAALDRNADGTVGTAELAAIAADCGLELSPLQCRALLRTFAAHRGPCPGKLRLFDFLGSISLAFSASRRSAALGVEEWVPRALGKVARVLLADVVAREEAAALAGPPATAVPVVVGPERFVPRVAKAPAACPSAAVTPAPLNKPVAELLAQWFREADADGSGYLSAVELERALARLAPELQRHGVPSDAAALRAIASYMDFDGNGRVNYVELLATMMPCEAAARDDVMGPLEEDLAETVALTIYTNRAALLSALRERFDPRGTGRVSTAEFVEALTALNAAAMSRASHGDLLPRSQIEALASELAGFGADEVEYEAFVNSFRVADGLQWAKPLS